MEPTQPETEKSKKAQILSEITELESEGGLIFLVEMAKHRNGFDDAEKEKLRAVRKTQDFKIPFHSLYQRWYTRALPVVRTISPERYQEFQELYLKDRKGKIVDFLSYTISDYLLGLRVTRGGEDVVDPFSVLASKFQQQLNIFASLRSRAEAVVSDIEGVLQAELFDTELQAAEQLLSHGQIRAAGALAGVTLERHLSSVCATHEIKIRKRAPTVSDYNDALKDSNVIDLPTWRQIQFLADIRNACVHMRDKEPHQERVGELIAGVSRILKQLF